MNTSIRNGVNKTPTLTFMDEILSHAGTMSEWFHQDASVMFFDWLDYRRRELEKQLRSEDKPANIYRLQGGLDVLEKIFKVPILVHEEMKKGGK